MNDIQTQITEQPAPPAPSETALAPPSAVPSIRKTGLPRVLSKCLQQLASLRLTVVLFVLSFVIVFCGTLAQVDSGIWTVVDKYFRSFYIWIPLNIFFPRDWAVRGGIPFPGGWLVGSLLLVNLLAAHAVRFKATWKRSGIILLHAGLIIMMVSELVTGLYAVEGSMLIAEGESANFLFHPRMTELAIMTAGTGETQDVVAVPMELLRKNGSKIKNDVLPFDIEVVQYMVNSQLCKQSRKPEFLAPFADKMADAPSGKENLATAGFGRTDYMAVPLPEVSGVEQNKEDHAAAYLRFVHKSTGQDLGTYLLPLILEDVPQFVNVDGKQYDVRLRFKRSYKPYAVYLYEFKHDKYVGTEIPKNFSSRIRLTDPANNVDRETLISMNDPFRYGGETFYQQSFDQIRGKQATILQVVKNPGWLMPYISCVMVAAGMMLHFGMHLQSFLARRTVK
ncbi:MAG TPA: cytochrome c biogenesis protein ResB [Gemmataceae bacterium]|nr:cytochrome c biogenesis protein ResB [Gemmataceae bacterium]